MASSDHYSSGLREIETDWSVDDVVSAHDVIDAHEEASRLANKPGRR